MFAGGSAGLVPRPRARPMAVGLACLVLLAAIPYVYWDRFAPPSVTVLDVGQADAILIRQGGAVALVDCGLDERMVAALVRNNVHHIDAVFVTHWDEDHWVVCLPCSNSFRLERLPWRRMRWRMLLPRY